jgi:CRISPR/Cas system Type II protein with McrA/HNH and RuvC-like nuclease domain
MKIKNAYRYSTQKTLQTYEKQKWKCIYCYWKFEFFPSHPKSPTWEHINPISKGWKDDPDNAVLACKKCNKYRWNIPIEKFLDGYIIWNMNSRALGLPDDAPSINIEKKVRGSRKFYHRWIWYELKF